MSEFEQLFPKEFHASPGVEDWRVLFWGAHVFYRTPSFDQAAEFVSAIAGAARTVGHDPDVDVRPEGVTVRTCSRPDGALAAQVSAAAHRMRLESDPTALVVVGIAVAQDAGVDTRPFWEAAFGYQPNGDVDLTDPIRRGPHLMFHELHDPRAGRGRTHIDVSVPAEEAEKRVQAAVAAGGRIVKAYEDQRTWILASPDNHGVDIAGWADLEA